jgi:hypothetical protein
VRELSWGTSVDLLLPVSLLSLNAGPSGLHKATLFGYLIKYGLFREFLPTCGSASEDLLSSKKGQKGTLV